ncbi:MAG: hypothetical protein C0473_03915 [Cyanobacteria bacterium DS3.002]|nr:hypothetical protein [Cyanobacteria bacterium DS3.002]
MDLSTQGIFDERVRRALEEWKEQATTPGATRAIIKSSEKVIEAVAAQLQAQGWNANEIKMWPADDNHGALDREYYLETSVTLPFETGSKHV